MARDITQLHPKLQELAKKLIDECKKKNINIKIGECLRTVQEQNDLYAQGRTKSGNKVTNAKGNSYSSMHQWGVAFDFFLDMDIDGDGKKSDDAFNNSTKMFDKVGAIGKSFGLEWGGDWKSPVDRPHFQLPDWGSTPKKLKKLYRTPDKFITTWKVTDGKFILTKPSKDWVKRLQITLNKLGYKDKDGKVLSVDGVVGAKTKSACPSLKRGIKNELVGLAQERIIELGFDPKGIDNSFGGGMANAIVDMKKEIMGSKNPTSTLGNLSWDVLLGIYKK